MKKITLTFFTILFLPLLHIVDARAQQYFLNEGFEGGLLPTGWTDDITSPEGYAEREWRYQNGGYVQPGTSIGHPPSAKVGSYNALFQDESDGPESRLITPKLDLRTAIKPELRFWHAMEKWGNDVDELRVYFRPDSVSAWVLLEEFLNPTTDWVQRIILLPNEAKTQFCQVAFHAKSNWGYGVCLDEVIIEEKGILPRKVESFTVRQSNGFFPSGSDVNPLGYIAAFVSGNDGSIPINSIALNYTGTNINDITGVSLYFTRDSVFSVATKINSEYSVSGNQITIAAPTFSLLTGDNTVWICFNIAAGALHGNIVDYTYPVNSVNLGGTTFPSTAQNPSGRGNIEESLLFHNMESPTGWTFSTSSDWQIGIPLGGGSGDPTYPYTGSGVMATKLNGNYTQGIVPTNPHTAISQAVNAKFYKNINIRYKRWLNIDFFDKASVKVSNDNGVTWSTVMVNITSIFDKSWRTMGHNISPQATRKENVMVMFAIDTTNNNTEYGGWNIDNFAITGDYIAQDVGILSLVAPLQVCGIGNDESIRVRIKNFGGQTVNTPFEVGYSLDNGLTYTKELFSVPIPSEGEVDYVFTTPANLLPVGPKNLRFRTFLAGDEDALNDIHSRSFYVFPTVSYPYQYSFEINNGYWNPTGTNSSWQWGTPSPSMEIINNASNGTKVWVTGLASNYKNNELSYLESPCFDLSSSQYPVIAFDYMLDVEEGVDGFTLQYSTNGGLTWALLPLHEGYGNHNWYDTDAVNALGTKGWSTNQHSYITAKNLLPDAARVNGTKFRFVFASNSSVTGEGVAIDNVRVYELPYDLGVISLLSPSDNCEVGHVQLELRIENFGYRPLPSGTEIPIKVSVNNSEPMIEVATLSADMPQGETIDFLTNYTYNLFAAQEHQVLAYTDFTKDDERLNDTLNVVVDVYGMPGYTLGPDVGTLTFPVTLDAGADFESYLWSTTETSQTIDIANPGAGNSTTVSVTVENNRGCTAFDEITIWNSDKDVGVVAYDNLVLFNDCENANPISPKVTLKNFGPGVYDGTESFPVVVSVDGVEQLEENFTPSNPWGVNATHEYTFTGTIDLSVPKTYDIRIYTKLAKDMVKTNDTTKVSVITYGLPEVILYTRINPEVIDPPSPELWLHRDSISTIQGDTIKFKVDNAYATYKWERKVEGTDIWVELATAGNQFNINTLIGNQLVSAWYRVTVTDVNSCGTAMDSTYINAKDLGVYSIDSPLGTICFDPDGVQFSMTIENYGQDTYPIGSQFEATCITPAGSQDVTIITENELAPGGRIVVDFPELVNLIVGQNFIRMSTSVQGDPNPNNDFKEMLLNVKPSPTVNIEPDTLFRIFRDDTYEISPEYSDDCVSYLWQDSSTDSLYYLSSWVNFDSYVIYKVIATNDQDCTASDSLVLISNDLAISAIKTPISACELSDNEAVTFTLLNNGNKNYLAGEKINVSLSLNGTGLGSEEITLTTDLLSGESRDITLTQLVNLHGISSANILVEIETSRMEVSYDNNSLNRTVYEMGYPTPSLGANREVHAYEEILDPGLYDSYLWQDNSTDRAFTATQSGTYSVTVVDFTGCEGTTQVVLTFFVDDLSIISLDEPISGCNLSDAERVKITFKNTGTWTIPTGTVVELGFSHDTDNKAENYTFTQPLAPNATLQVTLTNTVDMQVRKTHTIKSWVKLASDMVESNNEIDTQVTAYPDVSINFGADTIYIIGTYVLDPGEYFKYLWNTGATTQTITVEESGTFWVEVENEQGCSSRDTVVLIYTLPDIKIDELVSPISACSLPNNANASIKIKNLGEYSFPAEDSLQLTLWLNSVQVAKDTIILSNDFKTNQVISHTFSKTLNLSSPGEYSVKVAVYHPDDNNTANDTVSYTVSHWGYPLVSLGNDFTTFWGDSPVLDAGNPGLSYLWSTGATTQTITVTQPGTYSVTVTDANGCEGYDEITINFTDPVFNIVVSELISPYETCRQPLMPVEVTMRNDGEQLLNTGLAFQLTYQVTGRTPVTENVTLASPMPVGSTANYVFTEKVNLTQGEHDISFWSNFGSAAGDIKIHKAVVYPVPNVNLGPDTMLVTFPHYLAAQVSGTYLWNTGSTESYIYATQKGKYWLRVTNSDGCAGSDTIYLHDGTYIGTIPGSDIVVSIFPNPVKDNLHIIVTPVKPTDIYIQIISPIGRNIHQSKVRAEGIHEEMVDVSKFSNGIYLVKVSTPNGQLVLKVVVQR